MTGDDKKGSSGSRPDDREPKGQPSKPKQGDTPPSKSGADASGHRVGNQGAPGGTSDDDGDSENQQNPAAEHP